MTKYRIKEKDGQFYPQVKVFYLFWRTITTAINEIHGIDKRQGWDSKESAEFIIKKFDSEQNQKSKTIIHEYKP